MTFLSERRCLQAAKGDMLRLWNSPKIIGSAKAWPPRRHEMPATSGEKQLTVQVFFGQINWAL